MNLRENLQRLIQEERLAHAYVVQGDPGGQGLLFAQNLLVDLFQLTTGRDPAQVEHRIHGRLHPDVVWVEPAGAMRTIRVDDLKPVMKCVGEKSFEGGWRAMIFLHADRFRSETANKFLKTLEEPPEKTLILMVTASPEKLLTTIRSRCQFLAAPREEEESTPEWEAPLLELLELGPPRNLVERLTRSGALKEFFESVGNQLVEEAGEEDSDEIAEVDDAVLKGRDASIRRGLYRQMAERIERWYRDVLVLQNDPDAVHLRYPGRLKALSQQAESLNPSQIRKLLANADQLARKLETNLPLQVVFESAVV